MVGSTGTTTQLLEIAEAADAAGWDGFFTWDAISVGEVETWDPWALLAAVATRRGYDPQSPGVRRILFEVLAFAESPAGARLAQAAREGRLSREVPFLLRLDGAGATAVYLVGALDALVRGPAKDELTVIDYKYASPRAASAERYRLQLTAYTLAASRAFPRLRVRAALQFLRGDLRTLDLTPTPAELRRFEELAPQLAGELAALRAPTPAELGRDLARCSAEGCGYVGRCFGNEANFSPRARA